MTVNKPLGFYSFGSGNSSLFTDAKYESRLSSYGLYRKVKPWKAHIIVCRNTEMATKAAWIFPFKKILIHQTELFVDTTKTAQIIVNGFKKIYVVNGFNKGIFFHNYHFLSSYLYDDENDLGMDKAESISESSILSKEQFERSRPIIFIGKKRDSDEINNKNTMIGIDLNVKRQEIAQCALDRGVGEVIGRGWHVPSANSGFDAGNKTWWTTKLELISGYRFNIAFENTLWKYYVTEKIWHSIKGGCLPVYWGKDSSIYETFPQNSFIDASEFESSEDLIDYMVDMSYEQWAERMKKCLVVYNRSINNMNYSKLDEAIERVIKYIS